MNSLSYLTECHFIDRRPSYHDNNYTLNTTVAPGMQRNGEGEWSDPMSSSCTMMVLLLLLLLLPQVSFHQ